MKKSVKKWIACKFDLEEDTAVQKSKTKNGAPQESLKWAQTSTKETENFNFQHCLKPQAVSDLAVHSKKVKEVELWLQNYINNVQNQTASFLLITGPTGSGKTATVQVLCKSMSLNVCEWLNPMDQNYETCRGPNQVARFSEFLIDSKRNSLLAKTNGKKIILVKEFPNALLRNPQDFMDVLENCFYNSNYPIVFICTDSFDGGTNLSHKLFPQEIRDKYNISQISFNSCAATLMKVALRRAHNLVQENLNLFRTPSSSVIDAIIATSMGDIRCAINQYYFASLLGTTDLPTVTEKLQPKTGTKRKRNINSSSVKLMSKDENLGLFHGLGRILNPKSTRIENSWKLDHDVEKLVDEFSTQPGLFTSFLFENYIKYFGDLNDACKAADTLSISGNFLDGWVDRHDTLIFALWISIFGLMIYNQHKVSKWNQIRGPSKIKKKINNEQATRHLSITDLFYYNIIEKKNVQK